MTDPTPWWANDPVLAEIRRSTAEEFAVDGNWRESTVPDGPDPVRCEIVDRACWRELAAARDGLDHARARYDDSVRKARAAGYSWSEIGRGLGVSKQQLHRRFGTRQQG